MIFDGQLELRRRRHVRAPTQSPTPPTPSAHKFAIYVRVLREVCGRSLRVVRVACQRNLLAVFNRGAPTLCVVSASQVVLFRCARLGCGCGGGGLFWGRGHGRASDRGCAIEFIVFDDARQLSNFVRRMHDKYRNENVPYDGFESCSFLYDTRARSRQRY